LADQPHPIAQGAGREDRLRRTLDVEVDEFAVDVPTSVPRIRCTHAIPSGVEVKAWLNTCVGGYAHFTASTTTSTGLSCRTNRLASRTRSRAARPPVLPLRYLSQRFPSVPTYQVSAFGTKDVEISREISVWGVYFYDGGVLTGGKIVGLFARAVRGGF
jgi:hypothetical protein